MALDYGFTEADLLMESMSVEAYNCRSLKFTHVMGAFEGMAQEPAGRVLKHALALYERLKRDWQNANGYRDKGYVGTNGHVLFVDGNADWEYLFIACVDTALIWECG